MIFNILTNFILIWCNYRQNNLYFIADVDLYIQNIELFMLLAQTHNSEKGFFYTKRPDSLEPGLFKKIHIILGNGVEPTNDDYISNRIQIFTRCFEGNIFGETVKFQIFLVRLFFKRISRKVFLINGCLVPLLAKYILAEYIVNIYLTTFVLFITHIELCFSLMNGYLYSVANLSLITLTIAS